MLFVISLIKRDAELLKITPRHHSAIFPNLSSQATEDIRTFVDFSKEVFFYMLNYCYECRQYNNGTDKYEEYHVNIPQVSEDPHFTWGIDNELYDPHDDGQVCTD